MNMEFVHAQGVAIPALGFGTFRMIGEACARAVYTALRVGYRHIDTAEVYDNESAVGEGITASGIAREELFLTTKAWRDDLSPAGIRQSLEASLRRLGTDYVDLWLIHWPNPAFELEATLTAMMDAVKERRVRLIGVSNFPVALFERAAAIAPIACNQVEYHPYLSQRRVIDAARRHDAVVTAYAPLAMGRIVQDPVLQGIGASHGKSAAQVTLRWLISQPGIAAIPKALSAPHAQENIDLFDFALSGKECNRIKRLARGERLIRPDFEPAWDD